MTLSDLLAAGVSFCGSDMQLQRHIMAYKHQQILEFSSGLRKFPDARGTKGGVKWHSPPTRPRAYVYEANLEALRDARNHVQGFELPTSRC